MRDHVTHSEIMTAWRCGERHRPSSHFWRRERRPPMAKIQFSIKLDPDQLGFVERTARHEGRTMAGWIRHLIAGVQRQAEAAEREQRRRKPRQSAELQP